MSYEEWCKSVGIIPDTESREAWDYQQKRMDALFDEIENAIVDGDTNMKVMLSAPFRELLSKVQDLRG